MVPRGAHSRPNIFAAAEVEVCVSFVNNNLMVRPYLDGAGRVSLHDPRRLHERFVLGREVTRHWLARRWPTIETAIENGEHKAVELYRRELRHTAHALRLLRQLYPRVPAFAFNVGGSLSRVSRDLERLASEAGFRYIDIGPRMREAARTSPIIQADGAHWNEIGHAIAGRVLAGALARELRSRP
jgi:hypothetical protein